MKIVNVFVKRSRLVGKKYHYTLFARNAPRAFTYFKWDKPISMQAFCSRMRVFWLPCGGVSWV